jgi:selenocysteine lyase/cysteine desulfurase
MPVANNWAYFDHAAVGPIPRRAAAAIGRWAIQAAHDGDVHWPEWSMAAGQLRDRAAQLLHCQPSEIALVPNTTFGINVIAAGYPWRQGDSVVVLENEFPSNLLPWQSLCRRGVEVRVVPVEPSGQIDLMRLRESIDSTTRIVSVSWVGYASGYRIDLASACEIAHRGGAQLFVDAIQGLGVFPLDTASIPIDYAAADGHKWMLGPEGAGLLYIRNSHLERLEPMMVGWGSIQSSHEFRSAGAVLKKDASRYEGGSANHVGLIGLSESLGLLLEHGCHLPNSPVATTVLENAALAREVIQAAGGTLAYNILDSSHDACGSGIVSFEMQSRDPMKVRKQLLDQRVVLSVRHGKLRIATHAYNNEEDFDQLAAALKVTR